MIESKGAKSNERERKRNEHNKHNKCKFWKKINLFSSLIVYCRRHHHHYHHHLLLLLVLLLRFSHPYNLWTYQWRRKTITDMKYHDNSTLSSTQFLSFINLFQLSYKWTIFTNIMIIITLLKANYERQKAN